MWLVLSFLFLMNINLSLAYALPSCDTPPTSDGSSMDGGPELESPFEDPEHDPDYNKLDIDPIFCPDGFTAGSLEIQWLSLNVRTNLMYLERLVDDAAHDRWEYEESATYQEGATGRPIERSPYSVRLMGIWDASFEEGVLIPLAPSQYWKDTGSGGLVDVSFQVPYCNHEDLDLPDTFSIGLLFTLEQSKNTLLEFVPETWERGELEDGTPCGDWRAEGESGVRDIRVMKEVEEDSWKQSIDELSATFHFQRIAANSYRQFLGEKKTTYDLAWATLEELYQTKRHFHGLFPKEYFYEEGIYIRASHHPGKLELRINEDTPNGFFQRSSGVNEIHLPSNLLTSARILYHEYGHALHKSLTNFTHSGYGGLGSCEDEGVHTPYSMECASSAFVEGVANFLMFKRYSDCDQDESIDEPGFVWSSRLDSFPMDLESDWHSSRGRNWGEDRPLEPYYFRGSFKFGGPEEVNDGTHTHASISKYLCDVYDKQREATTEIGVPGSGWDEFEYEQLLEQEVLYDNSLDWTLIKIWNDGSYDTAWGAIFDKTTTSFLWIMRTIGRLRENKPNIHLFIEELGSEYGVNSSETAIMNRIRYWEEIPEENQ